MKFKAAVLVESKKPLLIEELEIKPLEVGQVFQLQGRLVE